MRTGAWTAGIFSAAIGFAQPAAAQVDQQLAQQYFAEARSLCERDAGRLWGVSICGPMIIGDMRTQTFATSQAAPQTPRPPLVGLVNAPLQWGGATWGAYVWDFLVNETPRRRNEILLHELFHGVQPQLGLIAAAPATEHLDAADGRYWLRLEWRALARALTGAGDGRTGGVRDALAFRQARRTRYPAAAESERASEIVEGLASYTATVLAAASTTEATASAHDQLASAEQQASFVRTFAYASGPAYGLLLDASAPTWRRTLKGGDDLGILLMNALAVQPSPDAAAAAARYDGAALRAAEQQREEQRQARIADLRRRFVEGPVLVITGGGRGSSDARGAVVIPGGGTVFFGAYRSSGDWGTLEANAGVLVSSEGTTRRVPAPVRRDDGTFAGDGWTFTPASGWIVREGPRRGDYEVVRQQP
jgi:hypothetical protein